jgi:hypothetical protein
MLKFLNDTKTEYMLTYDSIYIVQDASGKFNASFCLWMDVQNVRASIQKIANVILATNSSNLPDYEIYAVFVY